MSEYTREQLEAAYAESCERMERLMERLPEMERKDKSCKRLYLVSELLQAEEVRERLKTERAFMEEQEARYRKAGKLGMSAYVQSQMGYRQGPLKEAEQKCLELLKKSGFESAEEARQWNTDCREDEEALRREIEAFQEEYGRTLARCQQLDAQLYGDGEPEQ